MRELKLSNYSGIYWGESSAHKTDRILKKYGIVPKTAPEEKNVNKLNIEVYKSFTLFQHFCIVSRRLVGKNHCDCPIAFRKKTKPWLFDKKIVFLCKKCEQFLTDGDILVLGGAIFKVDELVNLSWDELIVLKEYAIAMEFDSKKTIDTKKKNDSKHDNLTTITIDNKNYNIASGNPKSCCINFLKRLGWIRA